jgi:hypothetical protein
VPDAGGDQPLRQELALQVAAVALAPDPNCSRRPSAAMTSGLPKLCSPIPSKAVSSARMPAIVFRVALPVRGSVTVSVSPGR